MAIDKTTLLLSQFGALYGNMKLSSSTDQNISQLTSEQRVKSQENEKKKSVEKTKRHCHMIKIILSLFLPLCCNTLKHCLLATSQIFAVQSLDPDIKIEPSMDNERLVTCLLKNARKNLTNNMRYEITILFFFFNILKAPLWCCISSITKIRCGFLSFMWFWCGFGVV